MRNCQTPNYFSSNLRFIRETLYASQEEAARLLNMSRSCYSALETGLKSPSYEQLLLISEKSRICVDSLVLSDLRIQVLNELYYSNSTTSLENFALEVSKLSSKGRKIIASRVSQLYNAEKYPSKANVVPVHNWQWNYEK